jgi:hypothetical protein
MRLSERKHRLDSLIKRSRILRLRYSEPFEDGVIRRVQ